MNLLDKVLWYMEQEPDGVLDFNLDGRSYHFEYEDKGEKIEARQLKDGQLVNRNRDLCHDNFDLMIELLEEHGAEWKQEGDLEIETVHG